MQIDCLASTPPCPMCDHLLSLRSMPDVGEKHWHCPSCKTEWDVLDLIKALNEVFALAVVLEMEKIDEQV